MSLAERWVTNTLDNLSLEARVGQMMMVGFDGLEAPAHVRDWLAAGRVGSIVLFARNVASPAQVAELTASLRAAAPLPLLICTDQEGGIVARLRRPFTESPGNMALGAIAGSDAPELVENVSAILAREMRAVGIDWNLAPCLDILHKLDNPAISLRAFGADSDRTALLGAAVVRGLQRAGVAACAKHFPGHGNTTVDSHLDLPAIAEDLEQLKACDLKPFAAAIDAGVATVMAAHILFPALDPEHPATLSPAIQQGLLRAQMGFDGVISTDCMEMKAVADRYGAGESTVLAILAGTDSVVHSHTPQRQEEAYEATLAAVRSGRLPEARVTESARRLLRLKARFVRDAEAVPADAVGSDAHQAVMREAARRALTMVRGAIPAIDPRRAALVEFTFAVGSQAEDVRADTELGEALAARFRDLRRVALPSAAPPADLVADARRLAEAADPLIIATRSASLSDAQRAFAQDLLESARARSHDTLLVCLRNPWDAAVFPEAANVLASLGDAWPSLEAVADALAGATVPAGRLPLVLSGL